VITTDKLVDLAARLEADATELEKLQATAIVAMAAYRDKLRPTVALLRRIARSDYDYADVWAGDADRGGAWLRGDAQDIFCFGIRDFPRHLHFAAGLLLDRTRRERVA
jgi:hypothetical protein